MTEDEIAAAYQRALSPTTSRAQIAQDSIALIREIRRLQRLRRFWIGIENKRPAREKT